MGGDGAKVRLGAIAAIVLLEFSGCHSSGQKTRYTNEEYGFSVVAPENLPTCRGSESASRHDTGIVLFLDDGPNGCVEVQARPHVAISASYNAMFAKSLDEALPRYEDSVVPSERAGEQKSAPTDIAFHGRASAASRWDRRDGWIEIGVVTHGGILREGAGVGSAFPEVRYLAALHTRRERNGKDLPLFRKILAGIEIGRTDYEELLAC